MAGRPYQFASDEGICCKLGTIAPLPKLPLALGIQSPTHEMSLRRIALAQLPIFKSCFDRSVMMFVNRTARPRRIGSCTKDRSYQRIWTKTQRWSTEMKVGVETGSQLPSPPLVTFVTFTRLSRILRFIAQIQSSFFPADFPVRVSKCRQTVIVFTASVTGNQAPHLFASNIHWLNWIFGILNPPSQRPLLPRVVLESSFIGFCVVSDTINNAYHRDERAGLIFFFLNALSA